MKQLKKFFETQKGCDEFEFRSTAGLIPLSAVAILCYAGLTIGLYSSLVEEAAEGTVVT